MSGHFDPSISGPFEQPYKQSGWQKEELSALDVKKIPSAVFFTKKYPDANANNIYGNGVMISSTAILTARHVAQSVQLDPEKIQIIAISNSNSFDYTVLSYSHVEYIRETDDPDLALVRVASTALRVLPRLGTEPLKRREKIYVFGSGEFGDLPKLGLGVVTTESKQRQLGIGGWLPRTVMGTTVVSFAGQSGSPIYRVSTGELVGIYVAGPKMWAPTGERVHKAPADENQWDGWMEWSWIVPLYEYSRDLTNMANK